MIFDKLKAYAALIGCAILAVLLVLQTWRLHREQLAHQELVSEVATAKAARTVAALKHEQQTAADEFTHARTTQENSDAFTISQPVRDAIARADLARVDRLRVGAERRAATYRAQAQANAAACSGLADRLGALDKHIVEGVGVVGKLREVVGRRDSEVKLLRATIDADRALLGD
jgi:hypothetical protein